MIYATSSRTVARNVREDIARAILAHQDVLPFVQQGLIVHIMDAQEDQPYYCVYCGDEVHPFRMVRPRASVPAGNWYFQHKTENRCIGTAFALGDALVNPRNQGCYVQLGCEVDAAGRQTDRHRTRCQAIDDGRSYCHCARNERCIDTTPYS